MSKIIIKRIVRIAKRTVEYRGKNLTQKLRIWEHRLLHKYVCDTIYPEKVMEDIQKIPDSNGCRYYQPYHVKIAIIADEFLYNSYKDIADFRYITPNNYKEACEWSDFLLIVSAWRGLDNEWRFMATDGTDTNKTLYELIRYYKDNKKKIVFYSKEDPPNYTHFLPIAKQCDYIFTSAVEKIDDYKRECMNDNVYSIKFGINPLYHNPIGCNVKKYTDEVIFSGSWVKKYPQRIKEQDIIFKGVLRAGKKLRIVDRNYHSESLGFFFPLKYYRYISPAIPHQYLQKVHKLYDWSINLNSVTESKTMFANRIFELQANGNLILSNSSFGVKELFPNVRIVNTVREAAETLNSLSPAEIYKDQMQGVRSVMTGETTFDRVGEMLQKIGFSVNQPKRKVLVVAHTMNESLYNDFLEQSYTEKEFVILKEWDSIDFEAYDMIALWGENRKYGKYYLEDMINAFKYTDCDFVTKDSILKGGEIDKGTEHAYINHVKDICATVFWNSDCMRQILSEHTNDTEPFELKNGYSIDYLNYAVLKS